MIHPDTLTLYYWCLNVGSQETAANFRVVLWLLVPSGNSTYLWKMIHSWRFSIPMLVYYRDLEGMWQCRVKAWIASKSSPTAGDGRTTESPSSYHHCSAAVNQWLDQKRSRGLATGWQRTMFPFRGASFSWLESLPQKIVRISHRHTFSRPTGSFKSQLVSNSATGFSPETWFRTDQDMVPTL